jgi:hypothetical protein
MTAIPTDGPANGLKAQRLEFDTYEAMLSAFTERGWGDGLPVAPATPETVSEFVGFSGRDPFEIVGDIPPAWGEATIEKVAVNAVMAGCRPEYMPVILAALEGMLEPQFNLYGLQATTHPAAPLVLVSGPQAAALGMNSGAGAFGPGFRANASIGRAVRLVLLNLGGARPGILDRATQGQPSKYTYCIAENDEESPWVPHRVHLGFQPDETIVIVAALENPHNINDHGSFTAEQILTTIAGTMATGGSNSNYLGGTDPYLFLCPEHAVQIAQEGFSREDVQDFLFERARMPRSRMGAGQWSYLRDRHRANPRYKELGLDDPDLDEFPAMTDPRDLNIVVVGGAGKHSSFAPPTGALGRSAVRKLP